MSNNKPNSTAHSIVQGMSSLLVVVHQYTEISYIHTCMNNINPMHCFEEVDPNSFEMSSLMLQHRCTLFSMHIPHYKLWIKYCLLLSSFIQSVFILTDYSCLPHGHLCVPIISHHNIRAYQEDITAQEAKVIGQNNHRPSLNLDLFFAATRAINPGHDLPSPIAFMYWSWTCHCL